MAGTTRQAKKWAVLIGIDEYDHDDMRPLGYAVADAKAVGEALLHHADFTQVFVLTSDFKLHDDPACPTATHVIGKLESLAEQIGAEDTFLFYFAGHGFQCNTEHFLGTIEACPTSVRMLRQSTLSLEILRELMQDIQARQVIYILDACRDDPRKGRSQAANSRTQEFSRAVVAAAQAGTAGPEGTAIWFACSKDQQAYEWKKVGRSVFAHFLLEGLGGQATATQGRLTINDLADYVEGKMMQWALDENKKQKPVLETSGAAKIVLAEPFPKFPTLVTVDTVATLRVESVPKDADVWVDKRAVGQAPLELPIDLGLEESKQVEVAVILEGYATSRAPQVRLQAGQVTLLSVTLKPLAVPAPRKPVVVERPVIRLDVNPKDKAELCFIPAGEFLQGTREEDARALIQQYPHWKQWFEAETPQRKVTLDAYSIYKNPVTVALFREYVNADGIKFDWEERKPSWGWLDTHPMVNVTWQEARDYCQWAGGDLPTEAQWEKAARGTDGQEYPWGKDWEPGNCNNYTTGPKQTTPVGSYPQGRSPYEVLDMAGNVWEWCRDYYDADFYKSPDAKMTAPENATKGANGFRLLRGGSWGDDYPLRFRCAYRYWY